MSFLETRDRVGQLLSHFANSNQKKIGLLGGCFLFIASVSALDIWFAVENSRIVQMEKNPICKALLKMDPDGCSWFIVGKSTGTVLTLSVLSLLHRFRYKQATIVTCSVALFQLCLLNYLTLSDPKIWGLPNFALLFRETQESLWQIH